MTLRISYAYFVQRDPVDAYGRAASVAFEPWKQWWLLLREYMEDFLPKYFKKYLDVDVEIRYLWHQPKAYDKGNIVYAGFFTPGVSVEDEVHKLAAQYLKSVHDEYPADHFHLQTNIPTELMHQAFSVSGDDHGLISTAHIPDWVQTIRTQTAHREIRPQLDLADLKYSIQLFGVGSLVVSSHELAHVTLDWKDDPKLDLAPSDIVRSIDSGGLRGLVCLDEDLEAVPPALSREPPNYRWIAQRVSKDQPCHMALYPCP